MMICEDHVIQQKTSLNYRNDTFWPQNSFAANRDSACLPFLLLRCVPSLRSAHRSRNFKLLRLRFSSREIFTHNSDKMAHIVRLTCNRNLLAQWQRGPLASAMWSQQVNAKNRRKNRISSLEIRLSEKIAMLERITTDSRIFIG